MFQNVEPVLAIEFLTAAQALDYRAPLRPGKGVEAAHITLRRLIPHRENDYIFQEELGRVLELIRGNALLDATGKAGFVIE